MLLVIALFARRGRSRLLRGSDRGLGRRRGVGFLGMSVSVCERLRVRVGLRLNTARGWDIGRLRLHCCEITHDGGYNYSRSLE